MTERLANQSEKIERLSLEQLKTGDKLTIITGLDDQAWKYVFDVEEESQWPAGKLQAFAPDGSETERVGFELHGAGLWTTRQQNPVQKQDRGFSSYFDSVYLNGFMVGAFEGQDERAVFDQPGQQITQINLERPEERA